MQEQLTLQELQVLIIKWAEEKGLIKSEIAPQQRLKLFEEIGETASAILKNNIGLIQDGIGDIFVVLVILFEQEKKELYFSTRGDNPINTMDYVFQAIIDFASKNQMNGFVIEWLNFIAERTSQDLAECANIAWNEIKDRQGKTVNGTFIKN